MSFSLKLILSNYFVDAFQMKSKKKRKRYQLLVIFLFIPKYPIIFTKMENMNWENV